MAGTSPRRDSDRDDFYPLKGSSFDVSGDDAYAMTPDARVQFVAGLLRALRKEDQRGRLRLKKTPKFRDEMRELRRLVRWRPDTHLALDERSWTRNVLSRPSPAHSTHSTHAAEAMVRMGTSFGHLPTKLKAAVAWLDTHDATAAPLTDGVYRRLRAADLKKPRGQREVPELFTRIYRLLDANDETKAAYRHYTRDILRTIYGHLLSHYNLRSAFPPYHARFLVDYYAPKTGEVLVLDPCAGWGGRLLGTLAIPRTDTVRYVGTDPNTDVQPAYEQLTHRITHYLRNEKTLGEREASVAPLPFEDWLKTKAADALRGKVDVAITSPPYGIGTEIYQLEEDTPQHKKTQSANRYTTYEAWLDGFLRPMCDGVAAMLKTDGVFILNIANVAGDKRKDARRLEDHANALLKDAGLVREKDLWKLAMARAVGTQAKDPKHTVIVDGVSYRYEPCFVWRKPTGWKPRRNAGVVIRAPRKQRVKQAHVPVAVSVKAAPLSRWRDIKQTFIADYPSLGNNGAKHGMVLKAWLKAGEMWAHRDDAFARVRRATQQRQVPMFRRQDVSLGQRQVGDWVVESLLLRTDAGRTAFVKLIAGLDAPVWCEVLAGDANAAAAMKTLNAHRIGTTYTSEGDVLAVYLRGTPDEMKARRVAVDAAEFAQVRALPVSPSPALFRRFQRAALAAISGAAMANHYSKKNKGKSWSALALYGFSDDPTDITKPSEVSGRANPSVRPTALLTTHAALRKATDTLLKTCGVQYERVRLMKLSASADAGVERHSDLTDLDHGVADQQLARIHLPIQTNPNAVLYVWDENNTQRGVHLAEGRWYYLDARKPHAIQNTGREDRIHLVVDVVSNDRVRGVVARGHELRSAQARATPATADYIAPDGTEYSRAQLASLVAKWRVLPRPTIHTYGRVMVVRDDLLPYGSKTRCLDALLSSLPDVKEVVFGSVSATGLGGIALADACKRHKKRCVLFMAKRSLSALTPHQREMRRLGAVIKWVPNGMLSVTEKRARDYATKDTNRRLLLPLGLEHPVVVAAMMKTAQSLNVKPKVVVSSASSGTLNRALQLAFPRAKVVMVPSGHSPDERQQGRAVVANKPYNTRVPDNALPPFPSVATWDAMAWVVAQRYSGCLFWNIGTDERLGVSRR